MCTREGPAETWELPDLYEPKRPRRMDAFEAHCRRVAEREAQPERIEATVIPHRLYSGVHGVMSVLRQWDRGPQAPAVRAGGTATVDGPDAPPTAVPQKKRPRPVPSPAPVRPELAADPFAFLPSEHPDDCPTRFQATGKRRSIRRGRGRVDYRGQLDDLETE